MENNLPPGPPKIDIDRFYPGSMVVKPELPPDFQMPLHKRIPISKFSEKQREAAYKSENIISVLEIREGAGTSVVEKIWIAFRGKIEDLKKLEFLEDAFYHEKYKCLLIPAYDTKLQNKTPMSVIRAIEMLVLIDHADVKYKEFRHRFLNKDYFKTYYPTSPTNYLNGGQHPDPMQHQVENLARAYEIFYKEKQKCMFVMDECGTGKTRFTIDLVRCFRFKHVLVICKKIAMQQWYEYFMSMGFPTSTLIKLNGAVEERRRWLEDPRISKVPKLEQPVYVFINWDVITRLKRSLLLHKWDLIVADESNAIANRSAETTKTSWELTARSDYRINLSGTPLGGDLRELWSQFRFLDPEIFGRSYYRYSENYCVLGGWNGQQFLGVIPERMSELIQKVWSVSVRTTKEMSMDMPPILERVIYVEPSPRQKEVYRSLSQELFAEEQFGNGVLGRVEVLNALTKTLRLQQVTAGILPLPQIKQKIDEEGNLVELTDEGVNLLAELSKTENLHIELGGSKIKEIIDFIKESWETDSTLRFIIFCSFKMELLHVFSTIKKSFPQKPVEYIDGSVNEKRREDIKKRFNDRTTDLNIVVANIQATAYSVDLPGIDCVIYHSDTFNYRLALQSRDRGHRAGRTRPYNVMYYVMKGTVDLQIHRSREDKKNLATMIIEKGFNRNMELDNKQYELLSNNNNQKDPDL